MRIGVVAVAMIMVSSCAAWKEDARRIQYDNTTRAYARMMEWSDFDKLAAFLKPGEPAPLATITALQGIKVTSYEPGAAQLLAGGMTVRRLAQVRYVVLARMSERSATLQEEWEYSEPYQRWFLASGLLHPGR